MKRLLPTLLCSALVISSAETIAAPELILHGGKVYTAVAGQPLQQAVAIENGKILAVGSDAQVLRLKQASTQLIDLQQQVLLPGFIDSHAHALRGGLQRRQANLDGQLLSFDQLEQRLRSAASDGTARRGDILTLGGLPSAYWGQLEQFQQRFNKGEWARQPILLIGWDYHTGWANDAMLARAGITTGGKDAGFLAEGVLYQVIDHLPPVPTEQLLDAGREAIAYYHSLGITAWMDPTANDAPGVTLTNTSLGVLPIYKQLAHNGELNQHVAALLVADSKAKPADLDELAKVRAQFQGVPNLSIPGIKVFADGVAEFPAQTAALLEPYKNSKKTGDLLIDPAHFGELVDAADARGWLVHVHAIGDRAVRESLNAFEQARQHRQSGVAHSITHLQMVNPKEFARFKPLDVIASMQLYWASADELATDLLQPYVSAMAYHYQYPARSLLKNGATIAGASDWPITTPNPWQAIYQAVSRKGPKGVLNAEEAIDLDSMLRAYTVNAARALRLEQQIGSLEPGKQADLVLVDRDIFHADTEHLRDTQVLQTWFAGKSVYQRAAAR
ncbi:amidohydrolase [Pseudomonas wadenswilerensis]|jgi:predicted amidohydrolase YtcJ|uniref:amidohydrolase n=1 Tax=Pseudomonas TaxID=286 RepID=UPI000FA5CB43|nr:amidohydrolase [Pseudomonas sp. JV241A]SPO66998.1 Metal-dependent hydrolase [Pseudomonas sp. JV241A]